ncbi:MAG: zinc-ribbon domain-containing protein [Pyrinomonadaceae bacterium]
MFCPDCGNQNPDTATFCMGCGHKFSSTPTSHTTFAQPAPKKSNTGIYIFVIVLVLGLFAIIAIVLGGAAFYGLNSSRSDTASSNSSSRPNYSEANRPQYREPIKYEIVNRAITLAARQISWYKFSIPDTVSTAKVAGTFTASGGSNDIFVVITDEAGLTNLRNGNQYRAYYDSGKITTDNINLTIPPGTYYVVFSNAHALMTPKAINANIYAEY